LNKAELKQFLDEKVEQYNQPSFFVETDPIQLPKQFTKKQDIEIAAFLVSTLSWGQRVTIINKGKWLLEQMDNDPYNFITNFTKNDLTPFTEFKHRTFNGVDCLTFLKSLQVVYKQHTDLEQFYLQGEGSVAERISSFKERFLTLSDSEKRTGKHLPNPLGGSSSKRFSMMLRWLIRHDKNGVDFGIWKSISPSELYLPLDVHTGNVGRKLGLLKRTQNDWKAVEEVTKNLRDFCPEDPVKYDFALFGLGAFEGF
jgi:uncharacterized protein (TIGR02757 family)